MGFYNVINRALLQQGQPEDVSQVLANLDAIAAVVNGGVDNNNIAPTAAITASKLAGYPADAVKVLKGDGSWAPPGGVDYKNVWDPVFPYTQGDVVTYQGVTYVAVNPSTGQPPPAGGPQAWTLGYGTSLPASPVNGQEYVLVDSTTAPTYAWRLRYNAGSASALKWEFIGGSPLGVFVATEIAATVGSFGDDAATRITYPRTGDYVVRASCSIRHTAAGQITTIGIRDGNTGVSGPMGWVGATSSTDVRAGAAAEVLYSGMNLGTYTNIGANLSGGSGFISYRSVSILPRRVA
jgi:hypothetical protein